MQIIKKIRDKNHLLILLIFFLQIILPLIIFGHIGLIPGDRLEGVAHDYIISKLYNGKIEYIDYFLGGSYEWFFFETIFYPINFLHLILDLKSWYFSIYILKIIIAYLTAYLLFKKLNFTKFQSSLGAILYATVLTALYQALFDLAFMPYLLYLLLKNKTLLKKHYLIIFFFGLNGGLAHNLFAASLIPIVSFCILKKININLVFKIFITFFLGLFITDIHLFNIFFSEIHLHREEMFSGRSYFELLLESLKIPFLEFDIFGYHSIFRVFLIITFLLSFIIIIFNRIEIGIFLILSLSIIVFMRSIVGSDFFHLLFTGPLSAMQGFNFTRVDRVIPLIMCLISMFALKGIKSNTIKNYFLILIFTSICSQQFAISGKKIHASIKGNLKEDSLAKVLEFKNKKNFINIVKIIININNYKNNKLILGNEINSWDNYFHNKEYKIIKKIVKNNRVMSVGIDPLVAVVNDIKVIDGYHVLYHANYKKKFRKIIIKELNKNKSLKGYYDNWGNRVYAFYNNKDSLLINFQEAKNLGANYIISGFNIDNKSLKLIEKIPGNLIYIHDTSWACYLCKKSDAFYLYEII